MNFKAVDRGELIAILGGVVLGASLFLSWFTVTGLGQLRHCRGPHTDCTGWESLAAAGYILAVVAIAPLILTYIVVRGHSLSWNRGELTAVLAMLALTVTVFRGLIARPGTPSGEIGINYGWGVEMLGGLLILLGSVVRAQESAGERKPPGVL